MFYERIAVFYPAQIEAYISNEDRRVVDVIKKHNPGQSGFMTDKPKDYYEHYDNKMSMPMILKLQAYYMMTMQLWYW